MCLIIRQNIHPPLSFTESFAFANAGNAPTVAIIQGEYVPAPP